MVTNACGLCRSGSRGDHFLGLSQTWILGELEKTVSRECGGGGGHGQDCLLSWREGKPEWVSEVIQVLLTHIKKEREIEMMCTQMIMQFTFLSREKELIWIGSVVNGENILFTSISHQHTRLSQSSTPHSLFLDHHTLFLLALRPRKFTSNLSRFDFYFIFCNTSENGEMLHMYWLLVIVVSMLNKSRKC